MILGNIFSDKICGDSRSDISPVIRDVLEFLKKTDFSVYPIGKHILKSDKIFFILSGYETRPREEILSEQHRKFIDVHYILDGEESIGVGLETQENIVLERYSSETDSTIYSHINDEVFYVLEKGSYCILFPEDIHRPGCIVDSKSDVKKIVVKISVDSL